MLILVLNRSSYSENIALIEQTKAKVEGYELCIDLLEEISILQIKKIRNIAQLPIIFTWKNSVYNQSIIHGLATLQPDFFDFDYTAPISIIEDVLSVSPNTKIIVSIHDYIQTPNDLTYLLNRVRCLPAHIYKIATFARSVTDGLRMMQFMIEYGGRYRLIGICMGNLGQLTRIAAPIIGSVMHYCYSGRASAPGQFSIEELLEVYFYKRINRNTQILALLGNPVCYSPSHYTHNSIFFTFQLPVVYIKLQLELEELATFCTSIRSLPFLGCSVTMPFKKAIIPFLGSISDMVKITQSVNTIHIKSNRLLGYNFDASGALDAIEETISISNRHIVILGGGGTAKSIAVEAKNRGATVTILNRSLEKITNFASELHIRCGTLDDFEEIAQEGYDIVCNATCLGMGGRVETPIPSHKLLPERYVMDVVFSAGHTSFTSAAAELHCSIIYGKSMFVKQAIYQMRTWICDTLDSITVEEIMANRIQEYTDKSVRVINL
ncbi:MAG: shikimate dehydrogenase [Chlamydiales bacterium]